MFSYFHNLWSNEFVKHCIYFVKFYKRYVKIQSYILVL